jgi:surface protein
MSNMFSSCINLISLNLENFSTRSDTNVDYMFSQTDTAKENITTNLDNWAVKPPKLAA